MRTRIRLEHTGTTHARIAEKGHGTASFEVAEANGIPA
jgi:hypothetical protein